MMNNHPRLAMLALFLACFALGVLIRLRLIAPAPTVKRSGYVGPVGVIEGEFTRRDGDGGNVAGNVSTPNKTTFLDDIPGPITDSVMATVERAKNGRFKSKKKSD